MNKEYRYPFSAFPSGWFAIGSADEIVLNQITRLEYFGRELIAFRNEDDSINVLDAYCVHLGANLSVGGSIEDGCVTCPFHGWQYDGSGQCVKIPYSDHIPEKAKIHSYPVIVWAGLLIVYHSIDNSEPTWTPDFMEFDPELWTIHDKNCWKVRVHIQEIGENGLDMPHFKTVHSADIPDMVRAEGIDEKFYISIKPKEGSESAKYLDGIDRVLWGLGISVNCFEGAVPSRVVITRTPIDEQISEITLVFIPKNQGDPETTALFGKGLMDHISNEVEQDVPIWESKIYAENPVLTTGDGPIARWRRWCEQFYTNRV